MTMLTFSSTMALDERGFTDVGPSDHRRHAAAEGGLSGRGIGAVFDGEVGFTHVSTTSPPRRDHPDVFLAERLGQRFRSFFAVYQEDRLRLDSTAYNQVVAVACALKALATCTSR
jgi:hypothetical protein